MKGPDEALHPPAVPMRLIAGGPQIAGRPAVEGLGYSCRAIFPKRQVRSRGVRGAVEVIVETCKTSPTLISA